MDPDAPRSSAPAVQQSRPLSCTPCRLRKVKCDRQLPCTQCTRKQMQCYFPAGVKQRTKKRRLQTTTEDRLNDFSQRVDRLCNMIEEGGTLTSVTPSSSVSLVDQLQDDGDASDSDLEGDSVLTAQATFATQFVQQALRNQPSAISLEVTSSLSALRRVLLLRDECSRSRDRPQDVQLLPLAPVAVDMGLPDVVLSMKAVQKLRESARVKAFWIFEFDSVAQFVEYFFTAYSGKPSLAVLIIVNAGLDRLFTECSNTEADPELSRNFKTQGAAICRRNLNSIISRLPLHVPTTFEFALALFMVAMHHLDHGRISKAWTCFVTTTSMCETLGLHRDVPLCPESPEARRRRVKLYWSVYTMEKLLSLRMARPSHIRDCDITISRFEMANDNASEENTTTPILPKWIEMASLQSTVYDHVYSPAALQLPEHIRTAQARALATRLENLMRDESPTEKECVDAWRKAIGGDAIEVLLRADRVSQLSLLTLIYRGVPPGSSQNGSHFSQECIDTAKQSLAEHRRSIDLLKALDSSYLELYVQWALLASPFVPFIVLFCHIIETSDSRPLEDLAAVVETLHMLPPTVSEGCKKQHSIFQLLYDIACKYIQATSATLTAPLALQGHGQEGPPMQQSPDSMAHDATVLNGRLVPTQGSFAPEVVDYGVELGDWFHENQLIFTMMEEDAL